MANIRRLVIIIIMVVFHYIPVVRAVVVLLVVMAIFTSVLTHLALRMRMGIQLSETVELLLPHARVLIGPHTPSEFHYIVFLPPITDTHCYILFLSSSLYTSFSSLFAPFLTHPAAAPYFYPHGVSGSVTILCSVWTHSFTHFYIVSIH